MDERIVFWTCITLAILVIILLSVIAVMCYRNRRLALQIERYKINVNAKIDQSIPDILDLMIQECFRDYLIKEGIQMHDQYINSEKEEEIRRAIVDIVKERISGAALEKLSLFYNIENIASILADKIYIIVMNHCVEHNNRIMGITQTNK